MPANLLMLSYALRLLAQRWSAASRLLWSAADAIENGVLAKAQPSLVV